ncbi:MAG: membrane dipeptidase, partial [candidate division Zixibacteria bacterium]|nr:membrane dipeptidase [candidate division Zixibacteria bacterium]
TGPGLTDAGRHLVGACNELGIVIDLAHLNEKGFWEVAKLSSAPLVDTHAAAHALTATTRNLTDKQLDAIGESGGVVGVNFCVGDIRREVDGWNDANTPIEALVRHMAYIADRIGIDHVAFGSDFDGATIPNEMGDVTGLPLLVEALHRHGFNHDALNKITHQNWLRVLAQTWK